MRKHHGMANEKINVLKPQGDTEISKVVFWTIRTQLSEP